MLSRFTFPNEEAGTHQSGEGVHFNMWNQRIWFSELLSSTCLDITLWHPHVIYCPQEPTWHGPDILMLTTPTCSRQQCHVTPITTRHATPGNQTIWQLQTPASTIKKTNEALSRAGVEQCRTDELEERPPHAFRNTIWRRRIPSKACLRPFLYCIIKQHLFRKILQR